jgi:NADPH2:quinone reductase
VKAISVHELGGPEVLRYEEVSDPRPATGQAVIKVAAAGVNFLDIYYRSGFHWGGHHQVPLPYTPGAEAAGIVVAVGQGVTEVAVGDRVAYGISNGRGSYAELSAVPAWHLVKVPEAVSLEVAAAVMQQGMTAHYLTHSVYGLGGKDTALVHAAAGGTGLLLIQMAKLRGARVIGVVSTPAKAELAKSVGADAVIVSTVSDFEAETKRLTESNGVNVVYDSIGKDTFERSLNCLAPRGMMVLYGQSSGAVPPFDTAVLNAKGSLFLARPSLTHYVANRNDVLARGGDLFRWLEKGQIKVHIGKKLKLSEAPEAHRLLAARATTGKILLIP